ncbi:IS3 family transposase [Selenomonas sputigena]|uniref:IS3 family transposase n=2 Tax=Selenomonas sputigena TaxID=69823 RepID=A0ABV3X5A2_9FIRM
MHIFVVFATTVYIRFFNEERPAYALGYLTPTQYRERFTPKQGRSEP